jgi:hypothetical protein
VASRVASKKDRPKRQETELFAYPLPVEADDDLAVYDGGGGGLGVHLHQFPYSVGTTFFSVNYTAFGTPATNVPTLTVVAAR